MTEDSLDLATLNSSAKESAEGALLACCDSRRWAAEIAARRPFTNLDELQAVAEQVWWQLGEADWLQAFAAHPRIGDRAAAGGRAARWSAGEQGGALPAKSGDDGDDGDAGRLAAELAAELAAGNREYERRFGYRFIVCATGRSRAEMLAILRRRLANPPAEELRIAAGEQAAITRLRLAKLLSG